MAPDAGAKAEHCDRPLQVVALRHGEAEHPEAEHERDPDRQDPAVWIGNRARGQPEQKPHEETDQRPMTAVTNSLVERALTPRMSQRAGTIVR